MEFEGPNLVARWGESPAQRYRDRSRALREAAQSEACAADRQNLEWVAARYELMARAAEQLEWAQEPVFRLKLGAARRAIG
jgi:hypothetical protein